MNMDNVHISKKNYGELRTITMTTMTKIETIIKLRMIKIEIYSDNDNNN